MHSNIIDINYPSMKVKKMFWIIKNWMSILKKLIEIIIHRRLAITILSCCIIIIYFFYVVFIYKKHVNPHFEFNHEEIEFELFMEKMGHYCLDYMTNNILAPIFGEIGAEVVFILYVIILYITFAEMLLTLEKELKIRLYYPLKKIWLRRTSCSLSEISNGVYKINSSNNAHQLGTQTFAEFMAYRIVQGTNHLLL